MKTQITKLLMMAILMTSLSPLAQAQRVRNGDPGEIAVTDIQNLPGANPIEKLLAAYERGSGKIEDLKEFLYKRGRHRMLYKNEVGNILFAPIREGFIDCSSQNNGPLFQPTPVCNNFGDLIQIDPDLAGFEKITTINREAPLKPKIFKSRLLLRVYFNILIFISTVDDRELGSCRRGYKILEEIITDKDLFLETGICSIGYKFIY